MKKGNCSRGSFEFDPVRLECIGTPPYELPVMACTSCGVVYAFSDAHRAERHRQFMEEKQRILAAVEGKIAGHQVVAPAHSSEPFGGKVIDLVEALRASLGKPPAAASAGVAVATSDATADVKQRKPVRRTEKPESTSKGRGTKTAS